MTSSSEKATREAARAWVVASCQAQGVPVLVTDLRVLASVAGLVSGRGTGTAGAPRGPRAGAERGWSAPRPGSDFPDGLHAVGVEGPGSGDSGGDDSVVENGGDDGVLPVEVEPGPLSA